MFRIFHWAAAVALMITSVAAQAGETEDAIINRTVAAYGGDALRSLKTLRIDDAYKSFREGQSRNPAELDQVSYQTRTTTDYIGQRKSMQSFGGLYIQGLYVQHAFFDGRTGYRIQHTAQTVSEDPRTSFESVDRGLSWRLDTALVKLLSEVASAATYEGEAYHKGRPHDVLHLAAAGYPVFTFYIDKTTGFISKMTRPDGDAHYGYHYTDHRRQDGILYAADTYVTRAGKPYSLSAGRTVGFNVPVDDAYRIPPSYGAPAPMLSFPNMAVQEIASGVYHAGQGGAFSVFVDAGEFLIASGGYPGLAQRYRAVTDFLGEDKPLKYQVVTHHHSDHIAGVMDAAALGAQFIIAEEHIPTLRDLLPASTQPDQFLVAGKSGRYADGLVQVVDIATWHADHNLVTYIPHAKVAFSADHFFTFAQTGAPAPAEMYSQFKNALEDHGLDSELFAAAHSGRILTRDDLRQSAAAPFTVLSCPPGWDFCD